MHTIRKIGTNTRAATHKWHTGQSEASLFPALSFSRFNHKKLFQPARTAYVIMSRSIARILGPKKNAKKAKKSLHCVLYVLLYI